MSDISDQREGGNLQMLLKDTVRFSLKEIYIYFSHCRVDIPDICILIFLCWQQRRYVRI